MMHVGWSSSVKHCEPPPGGTVVHFRSLGLSSLPPSDIQFVCICFALWRQEKESRCGSMEQFVSSPMRPTAGGIFFERNLRTKIISSNEERF